MPENSSIDSSWGASNNAAASTQSIGHSESDKDKADAATTADRLAGSSTTAETLTQALTIEDYSSTPDRRARYSSALDNLSDMTGLPSELAPLGSDSLLMNATTEAHPYGVIDVVVDNAKELAFDIAKTASEINDEYDVTTRAVGVVKVVGGVAEAAVGAIGVAAPEPLTSIGGGVLFAHGADVASTGLKEVISGDTHETFTDVAVTEAARAFGASDAKAHTVGDTVDMGISLSTLGAGAIRSGATQRAASTTATAAKALDTPQGITPTQFQQVSDIVRNKASSLGLGDDIVVQGSRANGTAKPASDIDIGIKVSAEKFDDFMNTQSRLANPNPGTALSNTRDHAIKTGKIQAGEARLRGTAKEVRQTLGGMKVDLSVIKLGGVFDNGAQIPFPK